MMRIVILYSLAMITIFTHGQSPDFPKEVNLVFDYIIKKDFPEIFNDKPYRIRPVSWHIIDIDDDGEVEVFLQTFPHYTQSPTITIYKISYNDSVSRIIEGLAPGRLIPPSPGDDYFSPHSTGTAVDMQIMGSDPRKALQLVRANLKFGMSSVMYSNFIHSDKRQSQTFIDLTYLGDYVNEVSCENFQFSKPEAIIAGKIKGASEKYFIAKCANELFCYQIEGFEAGIFIKKKVSIVNLPKDFESFVLDSGFIKYKTKKNKVLNLTI